MRQWYNKYEGIPYKHLGNDSKTGIDCFNLIKYIYEKERNIIMPYTTSTFLDCQFEDWYHGLAGDPFSKIKDPQYGWQLIRLDVKGIEDPDVFDVILLSLGSTNHANHTSMYVGDKKMIHVMRDIQHSRISLYGRYYREYTEGIYRWVGMKS